MNYEELLRANGPALLTIRASFAPVADQKRFQPAGFPEIGPVIYKAPMNGNSTQSICIVDSVASMANHLEKVCLAGDFDSSLHPELQGLPHVVCVTDSDRSSPNQDDKLDRVVCTTLTEGHRLASDYFLDAHVELKWTVTSKPAKGKKDQGFRWEGQIFREKLRKDFGIVEVIKDKKYYVYPNDWWSIFKTIFQYDPNSLLHGVLFAKEQIKIARLLSATLEAFGVQRVGRSGVKFDRLGKTTSGQPIFSVEEETADKIIGTFWFDLALLRSYGRDGGGLKDNEKRLLLALALWKIRRLTDQPFRFRSGCYLECESIDMLAGGNTEVWQRGQRGWASKNGKEPSENASPVPLFGEIDLKRAIENCEFKTVRTKVYYPASELFKAGEEEKPKEPASEAKEEEQSED